MKVEVRNSVSNQWRYGTQANIGVYNLFRFSKSKWFPQGVKVWVGEYPFIPQFHSNQYPQTQSEPYSMALDLVYQVYASIFQIKQCFEIMLIWIVCRIHPISIRKPVPWDIAQSVFTFLLRLYNKRNLTNPYLQETNATLNTIKVLKPGNIFLCTSSSIG